VTSVGNPGTATIGRFDERRPFHRVIIDNELSDVQPMRDGFKFPLYHPTGYEGRDVRAAK
jgi:hypothetical protein